MLTTLFITIKAINWNYCEIGVPTVWVSRWIILACGRIGVFDKGILTPADLNITPDTHLGLL